MGGYVIIIPDSVRSPIQSANSKVYEHLEDEYFRYEDQEVFSLPSPSLTRLTPRHLQYLSPMRPSSKFPKDHLKEIYDSGFSNIKISLQCTPMYDFCEPEERGQWCDIFVPLVGYLLSGESKAQWLIKSHPRNLILKVLFPGRSEIDF